MNEEFVAPKTHDFQPGDLVAIHAGHSEPFVIHPEGQGFYEGPCKKQIGTVESLLDTDQAVVSFGKGTQCRAYTEALLKVRRLFYGDIVKLVDDIRGNGKRRLDQHLKAKAQVCGGLCIVLRAGNTSHDGVCVTLGEDVEYVSHFHLEFVARPLPTEGERMTKDDCGFSDPERDEINGFRLLQDSMLELPDVYMWPSGKAPPNLPGDKVKVCRDVATFLPWLLHQNSSELAQTCSRFKDSSGRTAHWNLREDCDTLLDHGKVVDVDPFGDSIVEFRNGRQWCIGPTFLQHIKKTGKISGQLQEISPNSNMPAATCIEEAGPDKWLLQEVDLFLDIPQNQKSVAELRKHLLAACFRGRKEEVEQLLKQIGDVNCEDANGNKPIHYAAHGNQPEMISYLLSQEANINATNKTLQTALQIAVKKGYLDCVHELSKHHEILNPNIQDIDGNTALHVAIAKTNSAIINELIELQEVNFATTNNAGLNSLHVAAWKGNAMVAQKILSRNKNLLDVQQKNQGYAAVHFAAKSGNDEVVKMLLLQNCDVETRNQRRETPLFLAVREEHWKIAELLVLHGADINKQDHRGNTVLHISLKKVNDNAAKPVDLPLSDAVQEVKTEIQSKYTCEIHEPLLLSCFFAQKGAGIHWPNIEGITPLHIASDINETAVKLLMFFSGESGDTSDFKCKMCHQQAINTLYLPCGHWLYCDYCSWHIKTCPTCNVVISERFKTDGQTLPFPLLLPQYFRPWRILNTPVQGTIATSTLMEKDIEVKPTTQPMSGPEIYKMEKRPRGMCIIINIKFEGSEHERTGSEHDVETMEALFTALYFDVKVHEDLTAEDIEKVLSGAANADEQKTADCLVVVLMSHGQNNGILDKNGKVVNIKEDIYPLFSDEKCHALKGKPKLFFIQACRGDKGFRPANAAPVPVATDSIPGKIALTLSDMYCAYATVPEYVAYRGTASGSWFIRDIDYVFCNHAHTTDLEGLMRKVAAKVTQRSHQEDDVIRVQTPSTETYEWGKQLYFNVGCISHLKMKQTG